MQYLSKDESSKREQLHTETKITRSVFDDKLVKKSISRFLFINHAGFQSISFLPFSSIDLNNN